MRSDPGDLSVLGAPDPRFFNPNHPVLSSVLAPFYRTFESGIPGHLWGYAFAFLQLLYNDFFTWVLALLCFAHLFDWFMGRKAAQVLGVFDNKVSEWGLLSKVSSVFIVVLIRAVEFALNYHEMAETKGMLAVAIGTALIYQDIDSIEDHRIAMGARPIPLLSPVLTFVRDRTSAIFPDATSPQRPKKPFLPSYGDEEESA